VCSRRSKVRKYRYDLEFNTQKPRRVGSLELTKTTVNCCSEITEIYQVEPSIITPISDPFVVPLREKLPGNSSIELSIN
jgi:hypothetical protein